MLLRYTEGSDSTTKREEGFLDAMKANPGIEVVSSNQYGGTDVEGAYKKSESLLSVYKTDDGGLGRGRDILPERVDDPRDAPGPAGEPLGGKGAFRGVRLLREPGEGHDRRRRSTAWSLQDPVRMGYLGVKTIVAHIKGQPVEKRIDTGVQVATPANMGQPAMKDLLSPDLSQWLKE